MMKKFCFVTLFAFFITYSFSQINVASINLSTDQVADVQTQAIGDSLFVALNWFDSSPNLFLKKGYWVGTRGTVSEIDFGFLQKVALHAIEQAKDTIYYYYQDFALSKKREPEIRVMRSTRESKRVQQTNQSIPFKGALMGILGDDGLKAITYDKKTLTFKIIDLKNGAPIRIKEIELDIKLANFLNESITLINNKSLTSIAEGASLNKLYYTEGKLILIATNFEMETKVLKIDIETGRISTFNVPIVYQKRATWYDNNLLYFLSAATGEYILRIFDLTSKKEIYKKAFARMDAFKEIPIYRRSNKEMKVFKDGSLYKLMNRNESFELSILVEDHLSEKLITFGDFFDEKGVGIAAGSNPISMFAVFMVTTTLRQQFGKGAGQSRYSYLFGDTTQAKGFKLKTEFKTEKPWKQIIDDFEIDEQNKGVDFNTKNYQLLESKKIAVVYHKKKEKRITVLGF
jgi:hypothetical protein